MPARTITNNAYCVPGRRTWSVLIAWMKLSRCVCVCVCVSCESVCVCLCVYVPVCLCACVSGRARLWTGLRACAPFIVRSVSRVVAMTGSHCSGAVQPRHLFVGLSPRDGGEGVSAS